MFILQAAKKAIVLFSAALLASTTGMASLPAQALEIVPHTGHNHLVIRQVMVMLEFHNMATHRNEMMDKASQAGVTGNHMIAVQLLDSSSKQALRDANVNATITGPDKKLVGKEGMPLKWIAPQGRAPYYGTGLNLSAKGKYRVVVNFNQGGKASNVVFQFWLK